MGGMRNQLPRTYNMPRAMPLKPSAALACNGCKPRRNNPSISASKTALGAANDMAAIAESGTGVCSKAVL